MVVSWYSPKDAQVMTAGVFHYEQSMALKAHCETALYYPYDENLKAKVIKGKASIDFLAKEIGDNLIFLTYNDDSGADYSDIYSIFVGPNPNMVATIDSKAGNDPVVKVNVANDAGAVADLDDAVRSLFPGSGTDGTVG